MKTAAELLMEKHQNLITVAPDTTIYDALQIMIKHNIGAILIKENDKIVGIWTERDLMKNTVQEGFDPRKALIKDYMTSELKAAQHDCRVYQIKDKFLGMRIRHILVERDGKYIGILSAGDIIRATLNEKNNELEKLNAMVGWEYYENWRWKKK